MKPTAYTYASRRARSLVGTLCAAGTTPRRALTAFSLTRSLKLPLALALLLALGLLAGCTKDKNTESGGGYSGETITVPVTLTPEFMGGVAEEGAGDASLHAAASFHGVTVGGGLDATTSPLSVSACTGGQAVAMAEAARAARAPGAMSRVRTVPYTASAPAAAAEETTTGVARVAAYPATRSQMGVDESIVGDVWFVQLNAAGTAALQQPVYMSGGQLTSALLPIDLVPQQSTVYFLANSHDGALMNTTAALNTFTKASVEALTKTYTAATIENDITAQGMPMAGKWEGVPSGETIDVTLKRAVAKVTISLTAELPEGHTFAPKFIQVCRVPSSLNIYRDAATAVTPYPASAGAGAVAFADYATEDISALSITSSPTSFIYYLPENARGTGTGSSQQQKTKDTAPGVAAAEGPFCSYVQITGTYDDGSGADGGTGSGKGPVLTRYTVFLGADNTADYNIKRNYAYGVGITIKGGNGLTDARITQIPITIESTETDKSKMNLVKTAKASGPFTVSDASGLPWTVTSADPSWLKIATSAAGAEAAVTQTGTGVQTLYAYAILKNDTASRTAQINVSRYEAPEATMAVTQMGEWIVPPPHSGWAGCNVYWDGSKLTFDDVGVTTHENYQGVFFKWGSLVALSPVGRYNPSTSVIHSPLGKYNCPLGEISIPKPIPPFQNASSRHALLEIHDPSKEIGDICKYITDKGWAPGGKEWRIPLESEMLGTVITLYGTAARVISDDPWGQYTVKSSIDIKLPPNDGVLNVPLCGGYDEIRPQYNQRTGYMAFFTVGDAPSNGCMGNCITYEVSLYDGKMTGWATSYAQQDFATVVRCVVR